MQKDVVMVPIVSGVVLKRDGKFLLVQEKKPRVYGLWNFPAGRVDVGDTIEETAIKEAREECGLEVKLVRKIGIFQNSADTPPKHAFEAEIVGGELKFPVDEILDAKWFTLDEIYEMKDKLREGWILEVLQIITN